MNGSDIGLAVFIIIIFLLLYIFNILAVGISNVKKNWPLYRCNPIVMPFASIFGHEAFGNFLYCVNNINSSFLGKALDPIYYALHNITNLGGAMNNTFFHFRNNHNELRKSTSSITSYIYSLMMNVLIAFQMIMIKFKDTFNKIIGVFVVLIYTISGINLTIQSIWNGTIGETIRGLCFHPDTLVSIYDTDNNLIVKKMKDINPGDVLKGGTRICATMKINNLDGNDNYIEKLYELDDGENNDIIYVSGSHLIYNNETEQFIQVKDYMSNKYNPRIANINTAWFTCLITDNHIIPIGNHIFHDWEDNNGSSSKNLA